ncbi:MAG TPA: 3'-5' exonuclease, partial [Saprospiraceae bacterium]|nr:3'-5' exonuclease [Saprospiraceae bacterium]
MKKNLRFAVIDIETTGGRADRDRITEIGIVITDGNTVFDSFESLVNPEMGIPPYITQLTGIDNEMVEDAPRFYEIAKKIVELTEDTIFVAHNVRFDYGFIQEEFRRLGYSFSKKKICTVVMSRKAFPGLKSYSLGNLIRYFNIPAERRHRALDDAQATSTLLSYILESQSTANEIYRLVRDLHQESLLPAELPADKINALPEVCGVY